MRVKKGGEKKGENVDGDVRRGVWKGGRRVSERNEERS